MSEYSDGGRVDPTEVEESPELAEINVIGQVNERFLTFAQNLEKQGVYPETTVWVEPLPGIGPEVSGDTENQSDSRRGWLQRMKNYFTSTPKERQGWVFSTGQVDYTGTHERGLAVVYDAKDEVFTVGTWRNYVPSVKHEDDIQPTDVRRLRLLVSEFSHGWPRVRIDESETSDAVQELFDNSGMDSREFMEQVDDFLDKAESSLAASH